ncbi:MAG: DMT family transporter [Rhizobiales bacterium]|nr:DMT family transporter [Hyphomicrobiales bacterium]
MPQPSVPSQSSLGPADLVLYAVTVLIFSSGWLPLRLQLGVVDPEVSLVWRFIAASACMFAVAAFSGARMSFPLRDHLLFAVLGATLFSLNFMAFYYAGYHLASGLLSVLFALSAVIIPLMSALASRTWPRPRILAGAVLGVVGVLLVFGPVLSERGFGSGLHLGLLAGLAGALLFSFGSMMSMALGRRGLPQASANAYSMFYGLLLLAAIALVRGVHFQVEWTGRYLGSLAWLILFPTLLGYAVYFRLISRIGASRAGYGTVVMPILALLISSMVEDFHWSLAAAAGIALVLVGNVIVLMAPRAS